MKLAAAALEAIRRKLWPKPVDIQAALEKLERELVAAESEIHFGPRNDMVMKATLAFLAPFDEAERPEIYRYIARLILWPRERRDEIRLALYTVVADALARKEAR